MSNDNFQCLECKYKIEQILQLNQGIITNTNTTKYFPTQNTNQLTSPITTNNFNISTTQNPSFNPVNIQLQKIENLIDKPLTITTDTSTKTQDNTLLNQNNDSSNLWLSLMQNNNMTNEERLLYLLKHDTNIQIHPYILSILKQRENMKLNFGSSKLNNVLSEITNNPNSFQTINVNHKLTNNIFPGNSIINGSGSEFDFMLNNLCDKTQSTITKSNNPLNQNETNNIQLNSNNTCQNSIMNSNNINPNLQKFPIDDTILFKHYEKYNIPPEMLERPNGNEIPIKYEIFSKLIIVWDFLYTFNESLCGDDIVKYKITNYVGQFYEDLVSDINNELFTNILISFLFLAVKNLEILEANLNDKEVFIVKSFLDNPNSSVYNIFIDCISEILRVITSCASYAYLICENTQLIIENILSTNSFNISIDQKIILLNTFVAISYETVIIKERIRSELNKVSAFSIERDNLQDTLKDCEKRKREITKNDKIVKLGDQIQELQNELTEFNDKEDTPENKKAKADIELKIAKCESVLKENETLDERKKDVLMKIQKTQEKIAALKIPKKRMLGSDYKKGDYFYFRATPGKIFRKDKQNKKWYILDNKNDLEELTNKLCEKGINEKKLKYYMKKILQEIQMQEEVKKESNINNEENKEKNKDEDMEENKDESKDENMEENKDEKGKEEIKQENKKEEIILSPLKSKVIPIIPTYPQDDPRNIKHTTNDILLEIERKFSDYLTQFNKEWESLENREKWKEIITHTNNENNFISTLRMFNHRFKNPYKSDIEQEEMEEDEEEPYSLPDDLEKYVFIDLQGEEFIIYETDPMKILSPKVKIWPKEIEKTEVDKYYSSTLLQTITNTQKLNFALHFYEEVIFTLIKRRETKKYGSIGINNSVVPADTNKK